MPRLHQCHYPTCHELIPTGKFYCDTHTMSVQHNGSQGNTYRKKIRDRQYNRERYNEANVQYTSFYKSDAWRKTRDFIILRANGLCENCIKYGRVKPGKIVDHIEPLKKNWNKRLDVSNLQFLCQTCHNRKNKAEKWQAIKEKQGGVPLQRGNGVAHRSGL